MALIHVAPDHVDISCRPGSTILQALKEAGYTMFVGCQRGGCGVCRVTLLQGKVSMQPYSRFALERDQWDAGAVLACRAEPDEDITVQMDSANKMRRINRSLWNAAEFTRAEKKAGGKH